MNFVCPFKQVRVEETVGLNLPIFWYGVRHIGPYILFNQLPRAFSLLFSGHVINILFAIFQVLRNVAILFKQTPPNKRWHTFGYVLGNSIESNQVGAALLELLHLVRGAELQDAGLQGLSGGDVLQDAQVQSQAGNVRRRHGGARIGQGGGIGRDASRSHAGSGGKYIDSLSVVGVDALIPLGPDAAHGQRVGAVGRGFLHRREVAVSG